MKASDLFLKCLEAEGVTTIFGIPGEENADIMISLLDSPIEFVICRHEQAAAFMADMHGRLTGEPGVCLATLGPGATNLITGVASANMDYAPLVAIVGQGSTKRLHKESHQNMDSIEMFKPVTKWATTVRDGENIPEIVHKAFRLARSEKPGATVIELPEDIAKQETNLEPIRAKVSLQKSGIEINEIDKALGLLEEARFPILLAGGGCTRAEAGADLDAFMTKAETFGAVTFMGKGAINPKNPLGLACVGLGSRDIALDAFEHADLVITVGYDMVEWHPDRWNVKTPKKIIHIDTQSAEVDQLYNVDVEIIGNIKEALQTLTKGLDGIQMSKASGYAEHLTDLRQKMLAEVNEHVADNSFPMKPQRILSDLRTVMRDQDILLSDVGAHKMWVARQYITYQQKTCFITNGFCSMGFALPGAMEAKRTYPDRNVVALCGDGGFLMNVQDLITAVRYQWPITVLLWVDNKYGLIKWKQEAGFGKYSHIDLVNPDFVKLAEAFGCQAIEVSSAEAFVPALKQAFAEQSRPSVIIVPVDYDENMKLTKRLGEIICH